MPHLEGLALYDERHEVQKRCTLREVTESEPQPDTAPLPPSSWIFKKVTHLLLLYILVTKYTECVTVELSVKTVVGVSHWILNFSGKEQKFSILPGQAQNLEPPMHSAGRGGGPVIKKMVVQNPKWKTFLTLLLVWNLSSWWGDPNRIYHF